MSKKNALAPGDVCLTITGYLKALELARGKEVVNQTSLTYSKGWFRLRSASLPEMAMPIPYRRDEIQRMAVDLLRDRV